MTGIDLSLTGTGLAWMTFEPPAPQLRFRTLDPGKRSGRDRRKWIADNLFSLPGDVFCIEGLAFRSTTPSVFERAALWYRVVDDFEEEGCKVIVCPPSTLKKFVLGSGKGEKSMMIREVYRRWGVEVRNDHEADAVGLLMVGRAVIGDIAESTLTVPQREVVAAIKKQKGFPC